jgi:hypothetical protein
MISVPERLYELCANLMRGGYTYPETVDARTEMLRDFAACRLIL